MYRLLFTLHDPGVPGPQRSAAGSFHRRSNVRIFPGIGDDTVKRFAATTLLLITMVISSGCVSVIGNRGEFSSAKRVVVIDDQIYVVDVYKGTVQRVDRNDVLNAPLFPVEEDEGA